MPFKPGPAVDPAISVHLQAGDTARLRALAERAGTSVAGLLRQVVHGYLEDGHDDHDDPVVRPTDDDIDAIAERLGGAS